MKRALIVWGTLVMGASACGDRPTGVHVIAKMGALAYDELAFGVRLAGDGNRVLVDPETRGRFLAPFSPGDQDLFVYLADDLAGQPVRCEVRATSGGKKVAEAHAEAVLTRHEITEVSLVLAAGDPAMPTTPPPSMPVPPPPSNPTPAAANGSACNTGSECASGHCADGVCCESSCDAACRSCALSGSMGLCRPVALGTPDPRGKCADEGPGKCKTNGLCDISGQCAVYPPGTACASAGCEGDEIVGPGVCDGAGKCEMPKKMKCPGGTSCAAGICG